MPDANELRERLVEAAMAVLEGAPNRELRIVSLNKALFYLDLLALRDTGKTITGSTFVAMEMGPVVAKYQQRLVGALEKGGWAEQLSVGMAKPLRALRRVEHYQHLPVVWRGVAKRLGAEVAKISSAAISEHSHENLGWQTAWARARAAGKPAEPINMFLALQQFPGDADPWMKEPVDAELTKTFSAADYTEGDRW